MQHPDQMSCPLSFFREFREVLTPELTNSQRSTWEKERIPEGRCQSIEPVYKKDDGFSGLNHTGISLTSLASELFVGTIPSRLLSTRERCMDEDQTGFRSGQCCIDQKLGQTLEGTRPLLFLISTHLIVQFCHGHSFILQTVYRYCWRWVRAYGDLLPELNTKSGVPSFSFHFQFLHLKSSIDICPVRKLSQLEHADDVALLNEGPSKLQVFVDRLNDSEGLVCSLQSYHIKCCCRTGWLEAGQAE